MNFLLPRKLPNLEILSLQKNTISHLPDSFHHFKKLEKLNLAHNKLLELPYNFGKMPALKVLNLVDNELSSLPLSFRYLSELEKLELGENKFVVYPYFLTQYFKAYLLIHF